MLYKSGIVTISLINTQSDIIIFRKTFRITDKIIKKLWERCCRSGLRNTYYGETSLIARGWKGDKIKICIGKKQWIKTVPASGEVAFKIPVQKTGTVIEATHYKYGSTLKYSEKYTIEDDWLQYDADGVKVSSKKITVSVWFAKKGDVIKIKAGGKTYSKKVRKNYDGYDKEDIFVWTQKVKPLKKGSSVEIYIYNRFKQVRGKREIKVE